MTFASMKLLAGFSAVAMLLAACGGGGGGNGASGDPQAPASSAVIQGTAATGAALSNAPVTITNSAGLSPCVETSITTSALGSYTCTLKDGEAAPFFIVVTDPSGNTGALVSVATKTPAAGAPLTVNATPLTTAIVAQLASDGNPLSVVNSRTVDAAALTAVAANVVAQLAPVLTSIGAPGDYDPFTTGITAATADGTGNTADMVLDVVKVVKDPATGGLALTTIDNPSPVLLATATTSGSTVAAPDAGVSTLSTAMPLVAQKMTSCFALATGDRVLGVDDTIPASDGGPEVFDVGAACLDFVADGGNAAGIDFLHNGYWAGQFFHGLLTSDQMTGAKFSVPEILAFYPKNPSATAPAPDAFDRAILNIRYVDNANNPGSVITVAARIPNSDTPSRPTEWWLVGNQQTVDVAVRMNLRRTEQLNASNTTKFSTFQTGVLFSINSKGPGSVRGADNLTLARVKGPGLPTNGVVYKVSGGSQNSMDLWNKTGSLTVGSLCGNNGVTVNCPNIWFQRTAGITGSAATTLAANPGAGPNALIWVQPSDGYDATQFVKGARYQVELFYGANTGAADLVVTKTLLSDWVPATQAVNLPWNTPGAQTLAALDPNGSLAGAQAALPVDWMQNPAAPQIGGITGTIDSAIGTFGPSRPVVRGVTSTTYTADTVAAFTTSSIRAILLSYRSGDSSNRSAVYTYN